VRPVDSDVERHDRKIRRVHGARRHHAESGLDRRGFFIETYDSGATMINKYHLMTDAKGAGTGTYDAAGGSGKMKGMAGKGTCTFASTGHYTCSGSLAMGSMSM